MKKILAALFVSPFLSMAAVDAAHACQPYGLIAQKASQLSAELGHCVDDEHADGAGGRIQNFQYGAVDWDGSSSQAYAVHGLIAQKWNALGGVAGPGQPSTDEMPSYAGRGGRYNFFKKGGVILWEVGASSAHEIHGAIEQVFGREGDEYGPLGFPTSDEIETSNGSENYFEHGWINWYQGTSTVHVYNDRYTVSFAPITFSGGDPVGVPETTVSIWSNGNYQFSGHMHDASSAPETINLVAGLSSPKDGKVYTFSTSYEFYLGDRDDQFGTSGNNPSIAQGWADLESGGIRARADAKTGIPFGDIWSWAKTAFGYVSAIIAIA